jgi:hypothetical protein
LRIPRPIQKVKAAHPPMRLNVPPEKQNVQADAPQQSPYDRAMRYECDAPSGMTWFRLETEAEAEAEANLMGHAVDKFFRRAWEAARASYQPPPGLERDIGLKDHIARTMPLFLTLRDEDGGGHVTAMMPQSANPQADGSDQDLFRRPILVGPANSDPFRTQPEAIAALARHLGRNLDPEECYPYRRS